MNHFEAITAQLEAYELDAVLLTEEFNRFYAAGFPSTGTDGAALITREGSYYFTDSRYTEAAAKAISGATIDEVKMGRGYGVLIGEALQRHGIKTLGFDEGSMTVRDHRRYSEVLQCELQPATALLEKLRTVKDEEEIRAIEGAQRIAERALAEVLETLRPGVTEREVAARLQYLMLLYGAEKMSFDPIVVSGPNGSQPHGVPTDKPIAAGEFVTIDIGCVYRGYCSDMTRTVAVGYATEEMRQVYNTVLEAQLAGIAAARGGATGKDVDGAARDVITKAGYGSYFGHSFGHGVGVEVHEAPNASPANHFPMPCGAVITAEPGIYLPGRMGVRIEDMLVLTEEGHRNLTLAPKELQILCPEADNL